jgi:cyclohexa-1,5-dienecarbonyl-CoA hydratase
MTFVQCTVDTGVARLTLDAPPLNILTRAVLGEIGVALGDLKRERGVRVLLLTAAGKHFSAGADVGEHLPPHHVALISEFCYTVNALAEFPQPVIAAVQGRCLGGGFELVQAADLIVAGAGASFAQPEIVLGVLPPAACALLPRRAGGAFAARVVFTGDPVSAADAERAGLVAEVVPDADLERSATDLAARIARHSAAALRLAKKALRAGDDAARLRAMREAEAIYLGDLMATQDALEGLRAFTEKRQPVWRDV